MLGTTKKWSLLTIPQILSLKVQNFDTWGAKTSVTFSKNPIEEVWRIRDQIAAECGYDVNRLFERIRALEARDKDRVVQPPPRRAPMKSAATLEPPKAE